MSVKRFEEQVRDSMEELKFSPSENVWAGVVSELDKRRKRRVAFWWIPIGLLLVGSVYFWKPYQLDDNNTIAVNEKTAGVEKNILSVVPDSQNKKIEKENFRTGTSNTKIGATIPPENNLGSGTNNNPAKVLKGNNSATIPAESISEKTSAKNKISDGQSANNIPGGSVGQISSTGSVGILASSASQQKKSTSVSSEKNSPAIQSGNVEEPIKTASLNLIPERSVALNEIKSSLPLKEYQLNSASPSKPVLRNWSYGLNFGLGVAGIYDRNLIRQTDVSAGNSSSFLPGNLSRIVYKTEVVDPGSFFALGGFIERPVGKLFNLSAGLNYTRYNSKVNVGARINRTTTIFPGTQDNQDVSFYYAPDPKLTYQMHHSMIEIPLSVRYTYRSVSVNAGISGSTLISSDMLTFDARSGVYYKEADKLNLFQFGLTGGFDIKVLKKAKNPLHLGPVFRYQVSDITSRYTDSRHLFSAALQARFYLQR